MVQSRATTVTAYLASLPPERRSSIAKVRSTIRKHLPAGYRETMNWGMICYEVPLSRYPETYNGQPLCFAALAAQKNHLAVYLTCASQDRTIAQLLKEGFRKAGKKLDMGKSCVRFQHADDLPLAVIGKVIASTPLKRFVARYETGRAH